MRTFFIFILLLLALAGGYLLYAQFSGGAVPTFGLPIGGERAEVRHQITRFFEHVKFKNKSALASLVSADASAAELDNFLTQTFGVDPNQVDLQKVDVESVELDSSKNRARAVVRLRGNNLAEQRALDVSRLVFLYKDKQGKWLLDIKNLSL